MSVVALSCVISATQEDALLYFIKISRKIPRRNAGKVSFDFTVDHNISMPKIRDDCPGTPEDPN